MNRKRRNLLLIAVLVVAALTLTGCIDFNQAVDFENPPGWWEGIVVYPLAKLLIALNKAIAGLGIPYSYGWAIIVFTIAIKIVTLPLTMKQLQSTKAQQELQPKLRELQEKYGKDRQKLAEEQMKLYKESGVNPMGGCLPLLIQMPVLFGLYQALYVLANPSVNELVGARFFWVPDLSYPSLTVGTSWIGASFEAQEWGKLAAYFSLPIFMLVSQLLLQKMAQPSAASAKSGQQDPQTRMMTQMMLFMPIMFAWITLGLPSGLTLYWSVSNILSIIQQYFVTGWGGLSDWLKFLKPRPTTALAPIVTTGPIPQSEPDEPPAPVKAIKRRKRRR